MVSCLYCSPVSTVVSQMFQDPEEQPQSHCRSNCPPYPSMTIASPLEGVKEAITNIQSENYPTRRRRKHLVQYHHTISRTHSSKPLSVSRRINDTGESLVLACSILINIDYSLPLFSHSPRIRDSFLQDPVHQVKLRKRQHTRCLKKKSMV